MDATGEQVKPKEASVENLASKVRKSLESTYQAIEVYDFSFPKGHEARGDTPYNSREKALEGFCNIIRSGHGVAGFLVASGQKIPITDELSVSAVRAPSPREITYKQSLSLNDTKDPRTTIIEFRYDNTKGVLAPRYVSFSTSGSMADVSLADQDGAVRGLSAMLDKTTSKQLGELSRNAVYEKIIAAMRVEKPSPQKV